MLLVYWILFLYIATQCDADYEELTTYSKIKDAFVRDTFTKKGTLDCYFVCTTKSDYPNEVFQTTIFPNSNEVVCRCSSVKSHYITLFPDRYLEQATALSNEKNYVYVQKDIDTTFVIKPKMFYPLDNVSKGRNEGSLTDQNLFGVKFEPQPPTFDCSIGSSKVLRLIPNELSQYQIRHNGAVNFNPQITVMVWFKRRNSNIEIAPFLDGTNNHQFSWDFWLYDTNSKIHVNTGNDMLFFQTDLRTIDNWSHATFTLDGSKMNLFINGTSSFQKDSRMGINFGNTLNIGSRLNTDSFLPGRVFDGCLAHVALFDKALSAEQITKFANLINDKYF